MPATGVIGLFKITEMGALSAGVRRVVALTGPKAVELIQQNFNCVKELSQEFKVKPEEVGAAIKKQACCLHETQLHVRSLKKELVKLQLPLWLGKVATHNNLPFLFLNLENQSADDLRELAQTLQTQKPGLYFLVSNGKDKATFYASLHTQFEKTFDLAQFATWLKATTGLFGGGKNGIIQGGGPLVTNTLEKQISEYLNK